MVNVYHLTKIKELLLQHPIHKLEKKYMLTVHKIGKNLTLIYKGEKCLIHIQKLK